MKGETKMAKKFECSKLRDHYNPYGVVYTCDTMITSDDETQIVDDAVSHLLNDNVTHSLNEHEWRDNAILRQNIEDVLEEV